MSRTAWIRWLEVVLVVVLAYSLLLVAAGAFLVLGQRLSRKSQGRA